MSPVATGFWRLAIAFPFAIWLGRVGLMLKARDMLLALLIGLLLHPPKGA